MNAPLQALTEETLSAFKKAVTTGLSTQTGATSYDLVGLIRQIPIVTPLRELIPREQSKDGNANAVWRAFMNANNQQPSPFPGLDYAGNGMVYSEQDFQAPYVPLSLSTSITQDTFDLAQGLYDPFAEGSMQLLNQVLLGEDKGLAGGQNYALAQPGTITKSTATTGGSIPLSTTVYVGVAARTTFGYFYGGNSRGTSTSQATGAGTSTSTVTGSVAAVKGAACYDWFQSANGTTWYYYTTTTTASVTMTSVIVANNTVPVSVGLPDIAAAVPTYLGSGDNGSYSASQLNGLVASLTGDYVAGAGNGYLVTPGTSTANGAVFIDGGGAALTETGGTITQIENLFLQIYNQVKCSPTAVMLNGVMAQEIANLILASNSAVTYLQTDESGRVNITAGGRVGQIVNPVANTVVPIEVHPSLAPGTIVARTDRVPFPQANISNALCVRTLRDYSLFDYGVSLVANTAGGGPRKQFEVRSTEAFINRVPTAMGVLVNAA